MIAILTAATIGTVALGLGWPLVRRLNGYGQLNGLEAGLIAFCVGQFLLHFVVWGVGAFRYDRPVMIGLLGIGLIAASPGLAAAAAACRRVLKDLEPRTFPPIASGLLAVLVVGMVAGALAPAGDSDALRYHLLLPVRDLEFGRIQTVPGWSIYDYFPAGIEMLYRLALPIGGFRAAQEIHVIFACVAGLGTFALARRCGLDRTAATWSAVMFLGLRVVMYQSATADIDQALTAVIVALAAATLAWTRAPGPGGALLIGLTAAAAVNIKLNAGLLVAALGSAILLTTRPSRRLYLDLGTAAAVCVVLFLPVTVRNALETGNPLFPVYNHLFGADRVDFFGQTLALYRKGREWGEFFLAPFRIFLTPDAFDGHQVGTPYILAFAPFAPVIGRQAMRNRSILLLFPLLFFIFWYWLMPQQVRFLMPIFPMLSIVAAAGAARAWATAARTRIGRRAFIGVCAVMVANQMLYFGGTAVRRFPPAFSLSGEERFLNSRPFIAVAHYRSCQFLTKRLNPGERWLNLTVSNSAHCPQGRMDSQMQDGDMALWIRGRPMPRLTAGEVAEALRTRSVRYVLVDRDRVGMADYERLERLRDRYAPVLDEALLKILPIFSTELDAVYDVEDILAELRGR